MNKYQYIERLGISIESPSVFRTTAAVVSADSLEKVLEESNSIYTRADREGYSSDPHDMHFESKVVCSLPIRRKEVLVTKAMVYAALDKFRNGAFHYDQICKELGL